MKTGAISLRVADFLRKHPPFSYFAEEEILHLAANGRVRFHEAGETLYEEGDPQAVQISVIRQGAVRLVQIDQDSAELMDMLGEGDLLGLGGIIGRKRHRATAAAVRDTILYIFDLNQFRELIAKSAEARRFISAYVTLAPDVTMDADQIESGDAFRPVNWMTDRGLRWDQRRCQPVACSPDTPVREIAKRLKDRSRQAAVVCDERGKPIGIVTEIDFVDKVATGEVPPDAPVSAVMSSPVVTIEPEFSVGSCLLTMMRCRCRHVCVTEDGTEWTRVLAVVSETDVMLFYGNNPMVILREIGRCESIEELAPLRDRIDALLKAGLHRPEGVDWFCEIIGDANRSLVRRVIELASATVASPKPELDYTFVLVGSGGRSELLTRTDLAHVLIYEDPASGKEAEAEAYFAELAGKVREGLQACGFTEIYDMTALNRRWRQPEAVWRRYFSAWIRDPFVEEILKALSLFDMDPVTPEHPLIDSLQGHIRREIKANRRFLPLLANDALRELPPLTIFQGDAVHEGGVIEDRLRIKEQVTQPIVELARVFALQMEEPSVTNTLKRLELAGEAITGSREMFQSAAWAYRVGLYCRVLSGLRHGDDGSVIEPADFGRGDQVLLKNAFRVVADFQEFSAKYFGLRG